MKTKIGLKSINSIKEYALIGLLIAMFLLAFIIPMRAHAATVVPLCEIQRGLRIGASGEDVRCLQRYLNWAGFTIAATGAGSPGSESSYFGSLTANAVTRWQDSNAAQVLSPAGLQYGTGYFGPLSFSWYVQIVRSNLGLQA
jgi:hypothetical protein